MRGEQTGGSTASFMREISARWQSFPELMATTDSLSARGNPDGLISGQDISVPYTGMRYRAKNKGDEDKISQALQKIDAGRL